MNDPSTATSALLAALPDLEASLGKLEEKSWLETLESLSALDRAKMDILLSYAINDLIWVYLKLKGTDPATHEVSKELERVKKYYGKIKAAEDPIAQRNRIDKSVAHRFVLNSIPRSQRTADAGPSESRPAVGSVGDTSLSGRYRFIAPEGEVEKVRPDEEMSLAFDSAVVPAVTEAGNKNEEQEADADIDRPDETDPAIPVEVDAGDLALPKEVDDNPTNGMDRIDSLKRSAVEEDADTPHSSASSAGKKKKKNKNKKRKSVQGSS